MKGQGRKILITDDLHPLLKEGLKADGFEVQDCPDITPDEVGAIIDQYTGLVINSKVYVGKEMMDRASQLKFVCRAGSGLEVIDLKYAALKGITAFNSPEGNRNAVAEQALGMLLNLLNNISVANNEVKNGVWSREANRGVELSGKTVGLIAYGNTAQAFAKLLSGFEVSILSYDKYLHGFGNELVKESTMEEIAQQCDVLSLHLPLTEETKSLIGYEYLSSFRKPFWLLNTSRGKVLDTEGLIRCLQEEKIRGAALDVLENEKLETFNQSEKNLFDQLIIDKRVLLTPHIAGWTHESKRRIAEILLMKIRAIQ